ncbi:MAG: DUF3617 domain-containing protein [Elusimicrobia bacterium]|nr:DUF3617 domain-containing protein [Elusimicrobiota bacterium]
MRKNHFIVAAVVVASLLAARASSAAEDGYLWEVTSQMDMPDMPEGRQMPAGMMGAMGGRTTQVCRGEDESENVSKDKEMKDCAISDLKQTPTSVSMTVKCKEDRSGKMEFTYNKARTEYKGTMRMKDRKHGEMTMKLTGKRLGPCDAKKARAEQAAKVEKYKAQADDAQAQYQEMSRKSERDQLKNCAKAADTMNPDGLGLWGGCYKKKDASCKSMMETYAKQQPKVAEECSAKAEELCKRYQTEEGYLKAGRSHGEAAARMCGVSPDDLRKKLCKGASKNESYEFVGAHCPAEAKPLAKKHCAGRSYTVKEGDPRRVEKKWFKFCKAVAGASLEGDESSESSERPAPTPKDVKDQAKSQAKDEAKKAAKGAAVDALKGLFGR